MNVGSTHLELAELLAAADGDAAGEGVTAHLAHCPLCRTEVRRWDVVTAGTRHLIATIPMPAAPSGEVLAPAGRAAVAPRRCLRRPEPTGGRPRRILAAAAAGLLITGGIAYGLVTGLGGLGSGTPRADGAAGLTAGSGCPGLDAASGTLERVTGSQLVLDVPGGGPRVRVTVSAASRVSRQTYGSPADITDGDKVIVHGTPRHGTIKAQNVSIRVTFPQRTAPPGAVPRRSGPLHRQSRGETNAGGIATGTVTGVSAGGFTMTMPDGWHLPVTMSASTTVTTLHTIGLSGLRLGGFTDAVGTVQPGRTLAATTVEQGASLPHFSAQHGPASPAGLGCQPSAIAAAAFLPAD